MTSAIVHESLMNVRTTAVTTFPWPGIVFPIESDEGKAILGTPLGKGVARLLIHHRGLLGHKGIKSITYFTDRNHSNDFSLAFEIVDVN